MQDLKYPIGKFVEPQQLTSAEIGGWITEVAELPANLRNVVEDMSDEQLDTPYRPEGWTIRQVVHHLADSHMNAYIRFRLAMTENHPTIRPYAEDRWAALNDASQAPVKFSLDILDALHARWVLFLQDLSNDDWNRTYLHPESGKSWKLSSVLALYAWHGKHHLAHISALCEKMHWQPVAR